MDDTIEFRELVVDLENLEPGADGGREGSVEAWVSLTEALLAQAQRKVRIESVKRASSHPFSLL